MAGPVSAAVWDLLSGRIEAHARQRQSPRRESFTHSHPHFELIYIISGVRDFDLNGRRFSAGAGDLIIFRPGDVHNEYAGSAYVSLFVFRFSEKELEDAGISFPPAENAGPVMPLPGKEEFLELLGRMLDEFDSPGEGGSLLLGAWLVEFVIKLRRAVAKTMRNRRIPKGVRPALAGIESALEIMRRGLSGGADLERIAERAFMSASHFSREFKKRVGESPKQFQIRRRLEEAKLLLARTNKPAGEIALIAGYESPYFFYRQFKKKTGLTALQFRRASRQCETNCKRNPAAK